MAEGGLFLIWKISHFYLYSLISQTCLKGLYNLYSKTSFILNFVFCLWPLETKHHTCKQSIILANLHHTCICLLVRIYTWKMKGKPEKPNNIYVAEILVFLFPILLIIYSIFYFLACIVIYRTWDALLVSFMYVCNGVTVSGDLTSFFIGCCIPWLEYIVILMPDKCLWPNIAFLIWYTAMNRFQFSFYSFAVHAVVSRSQTHNLDSKW